MEINHANLPMLLPGLAPDRSALPAQPGAAVPRGPADRSAATAPVTEADRLVAARRFEQVLERNASSRSGVEEDRPGRRAQAAAAAYQTLQQADEQDYLSQLLGVDVFA